VDAFCGRRRLVSLDGMVFDLPDTRENTIEFGKPSGGVFPQARVVTLIECGSHVSLGAQVGSVVGKGTGERSAAVTLIPLLDPDMMLICDQGFYSFALWCRAAGTGADLLWRLGDIMDLPIVQRCGDGSFVTLLFAPGMTPAARRALVVRAKAGHELDPARVRLARVVEYDITDRGSGDLICLLTTILDPREASALVLAECYHQRWEHEGSNKEIKTQLRGPGKILCQAPGLMESLLSGFQECGDWVGHPMSCFVFGGWDVSQLAVQAPVVVPVDVLDGGDLEVVQAAPGAFVADQFGLEQ
jgi:hypothetical protein